MPAAIIGGVIAGAGAIGAAAIGSSSANKAADKAAAATQQASDQAAQVQQQQIALQKDIYDQNKATLAPYVAIGGRANDALYRSALGLDGPQAANDAFNAYKNSSGYNWKYNEGLRAINGQYAGNGTLQSGARGKALEAYGQGLANQTYQDWLNQIYGYNNNLVQTGLSAASAQAGVGNSYAANSAATANNLSNIYANQGNALTNAALVKGQNSANAASSIAGSLGGIAGSFLSQPKTQTFAPAPVSYPSTNYYPGGGMLSNYA